MINFSERTKEIGYKEGMLQATYDMILKMYKKGMSVKQISDIMILLLRTSIRCLLISKREKGH